MFVKDFESVKYYDTLPRLSKNVYDYLASIGLKNTTVADVGSGTGRITVDLLLNNNKVYAIDPDSNMRSICEKKCKNNINFISIDGMDSNMNIPDKSVNYVLVSQAFHRFDKKLFKKECNRVLKNPDNVIIIWYRVDYTNNVYSDMLKAIKNDYKDYELRYEYDEITGSKVEEDENNRDAIDFFDGKSRMENVKSITYLTKEEFINLGLSLSLFPIAHKLNNTTEVLKQKSFNKEKYINDLEEIFNKYSNKNKIKLEFNVQIHSKN